MYSDTHFHFQSMCQDDAELGAKTLVDYGKMSPFFALDIGTHSDDLPKRVGFVEKSFDLVDSETKKLAENFLYFSAGIWPDVGAIKNRVQELEILERHIEEFSRGEHSRKLVAIGECGLDHHWNPSNPDARSEDDFDDDVYEGEREMFVLQVGLAKKLNLPVIVHSRDAFKETLDCIDQAGYHNGIIHCYSYGLDEAKEFLDRGWYLAFGGAVTYTKKKLMPQMEELLKYVPHDRLLLETDAPYLSPVPLRGTTNTPVNIPHTYDFIAGIRGVEPEKLCQQVDENIGRLFKIQLEK